MQNKLKAICIEQNSVQLISGTLMLVLMLVQLHNKPIPTLSLLKFCPSLMKASHPLDLALIDHYPHCAINPTSSFQSKSNLDETNALISILTHTYTSCYQEQTWEWMKSQLKSIERLLIITFLPSSVNISNISNQIQGTPGLILHWRSHC